ncbi:MAG: hypothetical protein LBF58_06835 [Deltaproteobacteria bacterium]|nr:hypothetical protein [Deltaproteobacteria bacterium]
MPEIFGPDISADILAARLLASGGIGPKAHGGLGGDFRWPGGPGKLHGI